MSFDLDIDFDARDRPTPDFIARMRRTYPVERETDRLLTRKLQRRAGPPYRRISRAELAACLDAMLREVIDGDFEVSDPRWSTGGVSKIQLGFTLAWHDPARGQVSDRLMLRMDPSESLNTTSRAREFELLRAFQGRVPVPRVFWLDATGRWFPEPALIYAFVPGVTKPSTTRTGAISGLGTNFGPELRAVLAPQFLKYLGRIHNFPVHEAGFTCLDQPLPGGTEAALWQLNRARRVWEEDRGEDYPLMEVAANWLERNMPRLDHVSVVHGDYRSGNFLFDEQSGEINAWLDWERGHLGDRHRDLAWTMQEFMGHYDADGRTYFVSGLIPREDFYKRYEDAAELPVDPERIVYYRILNAYQIVVATLATGYRVARLGKSHQDILLTRVKGQVPLVGEEMSRLLRERL